MEQDPTITMWKLVLHSKKVPKFRMVSYAQKTGSFTLRKTTPAPTVTVISISEQLYLLNTLSL